MKKNIRSFLSCTACIVTIFASAQAKKGKNKTKTISENRVLVASDVASAAETISSTSKKTDTLKLNSGKPYVLLIDIAPGMNNVTVAGDDQEKNELIRNFGKNTFNIIQLYTYTYIVAANGQYLNLTDEGNSYQAIGYWSGNIADDIVTQEGKTQATEFISAQLGQHKESSYNANTKKYKEEVKSLQGKSNFTKKSAEVMQRYLQYMSVPEVCFIEDNLLFNRDQSNVKTITTYVNGDNGKKQKYQVIELNEQHQPITITEYGSGQKSVQQFTYKEGILSNIRTAISTLDISFDNDTMITTMDLGDGIETEIYRLEKNELLRKSYIMMKDNVSNNMNSVTDDRIEKSCINFYIDNVIQISNCSSNVNEFPFTSISTLYQDGKIIQETKYKIEKKSPVLYESVYTRDNESRKAIYQLNDKGLLESCHQNDRNKKNTIWLEYTYYE